MTLVPRVYACQCPPKEEAARDLVRPDGPADVVPTDQGSVPSLRRIAMYAR
jgi:hypothetical protein